MPDPQLPAWADEAELAAAFVLAKPPELDPLASGLVSGGVPRARARRRQRMTQLYDRRSAATLERALPVARWLTDLEAA